jgi:uncharacterized protein (TIGR02217 family)
MANIDCTAPPIPDFHDVKFFPYLSFGARVSVRYKTHVIKMRSGREERIGEWQDALREFDVTPALRDQADLNEVLAFFEARGGPRFAFKLLDPTDNTVFNGYVGVGNNEQTQFSLFKIYSLDVPEEIQSTIRPITCPDETTVQIFFNSVLQTSGYTINTTTGLVIFSSPPSSSVTITWSGLFYVPVRFTDTKMAVSISAYESFDWRIRLMEIRTPISPCVQQDILGGDFVNVLLPVTFSSDSTFGPEFATIVVDTDSGQTNRVSQFREGLQRFKIENPVKPISVMDQLLHFFHTRRGRLTGFLIQDYLAHSVVMEPFAISNGSTLLYQLMRTFYSGNVGRIKTIYKPVDPIIVYVDGVEDNTVSVNYDAGLVAFTTAPSNGAVLSWTGQYNTPVRFNTDVISMQLNGVDSMGWDSIELTELINGLFQNGTDDNSFLPDWFERWEYTLPA